jgi:anaerobic magnesium-protoporphyrin IX monomethyl ester cyclase
MNNTSASAMLEPKEVRALLIKPTNSGFDEKQLAINFEPLGLMHISSFVKKYSTHFIKVIDAQAQSKNISKLEDGRLRLGMSDAELGQLLRTYQPDVVGISCLFERLTDDALYVARVVKAVLPDTCVVLGGMDASTRYAEYLDSMCIDLVVVGSGEETFLEILDKVSRGGQLAGIDGTCERIGHTAQGVQSNVPLSTARVKLARLTQTTNTLTASGNQIRVNPSRKPKVQFDDYPYPDRDSLPRWLYDNPRNQAISYPFSRQMPAYLIQSSRGCGLRCTFCEIISVFDTWLAHSAEYVVGEMEECVRKYGTREFVFLDDNFMLNPQRVEKICTLIVERGLKVTLDVLPGVSVWTLSEKIIDLMIKAGLYRVCLPIESGNPETLKFIRKPIDLDRSREMIDYCNRKGLLTHANLIIGFPYETAEDIRRTIEWGNHSGLDAINYFVAQPIKGARMYDIYENNGWLHHHDAVERADYSWRAAESWRTEHFTSAELAIMTDRASSEYLLNRMKYFLRPANAMKYLWPKINSIRKFRYVFKVGMYVIFKGQKVSSNQKLIDFRSLFRQRQTFEEKNTSTKHKNAGGS